LPWTRFWQERSDPEEFVALKYAEVLGDLRLVARIGDL